ncbi:MAG: phenylalanine--tRNA ligase subunit alpha [Patescibacteria group bacterium]
MKEKLKKLKQQIKSEIDKVVDLDELIKIEKKYLGRKEGELSTVLKQLKDFTNEERKDIGRLANQIKEDLLVLVSSRKKKLTEKSVAKSLEKEWIDISLPTEKKEIGHIHPIFLVAYELEDLFKSMNFMVLDGPELESDYFNFQAVNIPAEHPAREMQDTFYIKNDKSKLVLRTHTSSVQVRAMLKYGAPLRAIIPGRVFRYEALDASHENTFDQLEGMVIDENISIANLIATMKNLLKGIFKKEITVRLRPGFFPFVEPGFELDMKCSICDGAGCSVCKHSGWVEVLPCGLIHPNVLKAGGLDPEKWSGFAFGLGLTRLVMMRYGIEDIRHFNSGDLRFLKQF